ncbi:hypothetical protein [Neobacillus cucumis]|uniref:Uncharacterized protein n=1 Tax=Neobacillus cucumis TaxID=1740721 RepID=A0A2N5HCT0_9BACI|nr:hypothetical protein [Neobacillus cucumis]PLS03322.1 hypothetical protein CVD27_15215 [Neobacillus cucumis]
MKKEELLSHIYDSNGNVRISDISSKEEAEDLIFTAHHLEQEGKIVLLEYCLENDPLAVTLKTKQIK